MVKNVLAALVLLVSAQPALASVTVTLTVSSPAGGKSKTTTTVDALKASASASGSGSSARGSGSVTDRTISAATSGSGRSTVSYSASFQYAIVGAAADSITPITFTFSTGNYNGTEGGPRSYARTTGSIYQDPEHIFSFERFVSGTDVYNLNLTGSSGVLFIGMESVARNGNPYVSPTSSIRFDFTAPSSVGYVLSNAFIPLPPPPMAGTDDAVPEPATWAMMIGGMGAIGLAMRRRWKVTAPVSYVV